MIKKSKVLEAKNSSLQSQDFKNVPSTLELGSSQKFLSRNEALGMKNRAHSYSGGAGVLA
jgi:hypothetical protein